MNARLSFSTDTADPIEPIKELATVSLIRDIEVDGVRLPAGSLGVVMSIYGPGESYCVEFADGILTVLAHDQIVATAGDAGGNIRG